MDRGGSVGDLVERGAELDRLVSAVDSVADGTARVVAVRGEPGIGKTRLLRELGRVAAPGRTVCWGRATEFEQHVPFGVFANALGVAAAAIEPARLERLTADQRGLVRTIFPTLPVGTLGAPMLQVVDLERFRLYRAVRALLEAIAGPGGLVLVLDDMHWADNGSIELCEHVLRNPPNAPLALVMAYRPRQLSPRLTAALQAAVAHGAAEAIDVGPLTLDGTAQMVGDRVGAAALRQLHRRSGGNPFYLETLVRSVGAERPANQPHSVHLALSAELGALNPTQSAVAHAGAVVGDTFEPDVVAEVAGMAIDAVLSATDGLVRRDLVRTTRDGTGFEFRHPLVRKAAYESAGAGWRVAAHRRAAAALARRGAPVVMRAHHVERAAQRGDEASVDVLVEAARVTMQTAPLVAAHWLRAALRLLPDDSGRAARRLALLGQLARALGVTGRLRESRDIAHEVLGLLPPDDTVQRAQHVAFAAMIERLLGRHAEARAILVTELNGLPDGEYRAAAILNVGLAAAGIMGGDFAAVRSWADAAVATARRLDDRPLLAAALGAYLSAAHITGNGAAQPGRYLEEASTVVDSLPDGELVRHLEAVMWLGWGELFADRLADANRHLERGMELARRTGRNYVATYLLMGLSTGYGLVGRLADAVECSQDALEVAHLNGSDELRTMALTKLCWIKAWQGDVAGAIRAGEVAVELAGSVRDWYSGLARAMLAQARLYAGDAPGCIELLLAAGGGPELPALDAMSRPNWYQLLAYAEYTRANADAAQAWADRACAVAAEVGVPSRTAAAHLGQGHALLLVDPRRAAQVAQSAADVFEGLDIRVEAGRAHLVAGTAFGKLDDTARARHHFAQAKTAFEACGAGLFLEHTAREERRMNARRPRRRGAEAGDTALTSREREIGNLVARGLTNREIAERLYLSPRTVEVHLSRIFTKLEVSNRSALAHALAKAG